jgi:hypothetical protein
MIDIPSALVSLALQRPLFHSEADFQHALAWHLQAIHPTANIRLEVPVEPLTEASHVDIVIAEGGKELVLELKYKTRDLACTVRGERFRLKGQSAQDIGRYDFLKDVERVEQVVAANPLSLGFALLLTNDSSYWKPPRDSGTVDAAFRLTEGRTLRGPLAWSPRAAKGTIDKREKILRLRGEYPLHWDDYSRVNAGTYSVFKYLLLNIEGKTEHA